MKISKSDRTKLVASLRKAGFKSQPERATCEGRHRLYRCSSPSEKLPMWQASIMVEAIIEIDWAENWAIVGIHKVLRTPENRREMIVLESSKAMDVKKLWITTRAKAQAKLADELKFLVALNSVLSKFCPTL